MDNVNLAGTLEARAGRWGWPVPAVGQAAPLRRKEAAEGLLRGEGARGRRDTDRTGLPAAGLRGPQEGWPAGTSWAGVPGESAAGLQKEQTQEAQTCFSEKPGVRGVGSPETHQEDAFRVL